VPDAAEGGLRPVGGGDSSAPKLRPVVRPVPANSKPHLVAPTSFNDAQEVADKFKASQPVVMDLREADGKLARRLIDFSSGVCYCLGGGMEKLGAQVYLLSPEGVVVSDDERRRLQERGFAD
jgi:cell division inhibitor SepF